MNVIYLCRIRSAPFRPFSIASSLICYLELTTPCLWKKDFRSKRQKEKGRKSEKKANELWRGFEEKRSAREIGFPELLWTAGGGGGRGWKTWSGRRSFRYSPFNGLLVVGRIEREFLFRAARQIVAREVENVTRQWWMFNNVYRTLTYRVLDAIQNAVVRTRCDFAKGINSLWQGEILIANNGERYLGFRSRLRSMVFVLLTFPFACSRSGERRVLRFVLVCFD